jgi:mRNA interferase MazF
MKIEKWSVYHANLDPVIGSEQGKSRPVLVISENDINELLNIINIIPITSRKPGRVIYPNEAVLLPGKTGLKNESVVLCHQIRTIDKRRISGLYGVIPEEEKQAEILDAICFQLGTERKR